MSTKKEKKEENKRLSGLFVWGAYALGLFQGVIVSSLNGWISWAVAGIGICIYYAILTWHKKMVMK